MPPYLEVAAKLRHRITSGELHPGQQLPPLPQLCEDFGFTRNTISRALKVLRDEGLIEYTPGWGTFVRMDNTHRSST